MRLATLFLLLLTPLSAVPPALRDGEALTYRVGWGVFYHAGEITISATAIAGAGSPAMLKVTTITETKGFARALYTFEGRADAMFDASTGRLASIVETTKMPNKEKKYSITFDYAKATANYVNPLETDKNAVIPVPPGDVFDIIMCLVQTRTWDLKPGETRDALVIHEDEFYDLTIHAVGFEEVYTPMGTFNALVLEPRMERTPPKGMFKRDSVVRVWISQDERHLPVKFQLEFKFGKGVATLTHYQPPASAEPTPGRSATAEAANPTPSTDAKPDAKDSRP